MRQKNLRYYECGVVHLILPLLFLIAILIGLLLLVYSGVIKNPFAKPLQQLVGKKEPAVTLQKQYQNPFDKSAQYVNPFSAFKNPFDLLKK